MKLEEALTFDDVQIIPRYSSIETRSRCVTMTNFTRNWNINIPLVGAPMDTVCDVEMVMALSALGGIGCLHRFMSTGNQIMHLQYLKNKHTETAPIVASVGVIGDYQERLEKSIDAGANIILLDVAHGHHKNVKTAMAWINALSYRTKFDVILGNIATSDAAVDLEEWGADALRVGIGGGSMCETRIRTGIGIPQLTALRSVVEVATVPVISDGGIRYPGDVAKALAAGADSVMIGSLFAGTDEAPGDVIVAGKWPNEHRMKMFRGSASATAKLAVNGNTANVEGASKLIETKGSVYKIVSDIMDGVRSSMSYVGAHNLAEFRRQASFIKITHAGLLEAHPHGLK